MRNQDKIHPHAKYPCQLEVHPVVEKLARDLQLVVDKQDTDWATFPPAAFMSPIMYAVGDLMAAKTHDEAMECAARVAFSAMATAEALGRMVRLHSEQQAKAASPIIQPARMLRVPR